MPAAPQRPVEEAFGRVLRALREERGLSQEQLAHEAGSGRTFVSELERGVKGVSLSTLFRLAAVLEVAPFVLIRRVEAEMAAPSRGRKGTSSGAARAARRPRASGPGRASI